MGGVSQTKIMILTKNLRKLLVAMIMPPNWSHLIKTILTCMMTKQNSAESNGTSNFRSPLGKGSYPAMTFTKCKQNFALQRGKNGKVSAGLRISILHTYPRL